MIERKFTERLWRGNSGNCVLEFEGLEGDTCAWKLEGGFVGE